MVATELAVIEEADGDPDDHEEDRVSRRIDKLGYDDVSVIFSAQSETVNIEAVADIPLDDDDDGNEKNGDLSPISWVISNEEHPHDQSGGTAVGLTSFSSSTSLSGGGASLVTAASSLTDGATAHSIKGSAVSQSSPGKCVAIRCHEWSRAAVGVALFWWCFGVGLSLSMSSRLCSEERLILLQLQAWALLFDVCLGQMVFVGLVWLHHWLVSDNDTPDSSDDGEEAIDQQRQRDEEGAVSEDASNNRQGGCTAVIRCGARVIYPVDGAVVNC